jgi:hypothetical protein
MPTDGTVVCGPPRWFSTAIVAIAPMSIAQTMMRGRLDIGLPFFAVGSICRTKAAAHAIPLSPVHVPPCRQRDDGKGS